MATATLSSSNDKHLETFCILWLDANSKETRDTEQKLRSTINYLKKFQDIDQCQQYIKRAEKNDRFIIIVSGQLGRELVPAIHTHRQVVSIYIYCMDRERNKQWSSKYSKVKAVVVQLDELVNCVTGDHATLKKVEEPLSYTTFSTTGGKSTTGLNGEFIFNRILIDCLLQLESTKIDIAELISICEVEYKGNLSELSNLRDFQQDYSPEKVLRWYTNESFFYKVLNGALRNRNILILILFRSFIVDIYQQLKGHQSKRPLTVYRGQMISNDELQSLRNSVNKYISINSFFSASTDPKKALLFLRESDDLKRILFKIYADPKTATTRPFADISKYSVFPDEAEILFMLDSIFCLDKIDYHNDEDIWIIHMTFRNEVENELKQVFLSMKEGIMDEKVNLQTLGKILQEMGQVDLAEKYFIRFLNELVPNDPLRISLYKDLGKLAANRQDLDKSLEWHKKAVELKQHLALSAKSRNGKAPTSASKQKPMLKGKISSSYEDEDVSLTNFEQTQHSETNDPPKTWAAFDELGLRIVSSHKNNTIKIDNGTTHTEILVRAPADVVLMGTLNNSQDEEIFGGDRVFFDRHHRVWRCLFAPNQNGTFKATILAKRKSDSGRYTGVCRYNVEARKISSTPLSYPKTWQLFHDLDLEIETPYNRATLAWPDNASYIEIRMRAPNDVYLSCNIKYKDIKVENGTLSQFDSDRHNWQLLFAPQRTGLHSLYVYGRRESNADSTSSSVAEFHLNVSQLKRCIKFPKTYSKFHTNKCRLIEPMNGTLERGSVVLIHCIIPGATDVDVTTDSNWNKSEGYKDPIFKTRVTVGSKDVEVYAKYGQTNSYDGLFKYNVQ
ncbi:hypothetical protein I4U23_023039 [Adineta vaga]|nr:hypothetical protein I4U23_023039 [Adineta vaga]